MKRVNSASSLIWSALLITLTVGCGPAPTTLDSLPLPPFAVEGKYNGGFEARVDQKVNEMQSSLEPRYGPLEIGNFGLVEEGKAWKDIKAFYSQLSVQKALTDAGFVRQTVDNSFQSSQLALWRRGRTFGKDELLGVIYIPGYPGDPLNFILRFHAPLRKR